MFLNCETKLLIICLVFEQIVFFLINILIHHLIHLVVFFVINLNLVSKTNYVRQVIFNDFIIIFIKKSIK